MGYRPKIIETITYYYYRGSDLVADTKPQQRKKEESDRPIGEGEQIKFIDLRLERV